MSKRSGRKKIKANRKPKIVRDRTWRTRVLRGEIEEAEIEELGLPEVERILPRSREEERVKLRARVDRELAGESATTANEVEAPPEWQRGIVTCISTSIYHVDLGEETILCGVRGSLSATQTGYTNVVAVGDGVLVSLGDARHGIIEQVLPRRTALARPDVFNEDMSQIIVSNIDQLLIVAAWEEPRVWLELIDRYLIAAAEGKMEPLICLNKIDLAIEERDCREEMSIYENLGHTVLYTSIVTGQGIEELRTHLVDRSTVLAGLSGVGKSSLLNAIQPGLQLRVADVSYYSGEGRHTTSQISLLKLDEGGYVVDTPGIRELGLITTHRHELVLHYPEIAELIGQCKFNDCTHMHEPGCAVVNAVEQGDIPWSRYASYQMIYESLPEYYTE
ncbi:MAG: ribosome small subunit-dependent GTPase A [Planctomycetota bacterium]